jgi:hypothetical protein
MFPPYRETYPNLHTSLRSFRFGAGNHVIKDMQEVTEFVYFSGTVEWALLERKIYFIL